MNAEQTPILSRVVDLEMARVIEHWHCEDDAVHVCLTLEASCRCGAKHYWFVNRDGSTRCVDCDRKYLEERAEKLAAALEAIAR